MDVRAPVDKIGQFLKKYRYVVLILLIGIVLMMIPSVSDSKDEENQDILSQQVTEQTIEEKLAVILSQINGAGDVAVMLTASTGEEIVYQVDSKSDEQGDTADISINTVVITDKDKNESGLIRQINPPVYLGAIVVCQGADDPNVQLAITDAVSKITGLGTHHISVLKMK